MCVICPKLCNSASQKLRHLSLLCSTQNLQDRRQEWWLYDRLHIELSIRIFCLQPVAAQGFMTCLYEIKAL